MPSCNSVSILLCYKRFPPILLEIACLISSIIGITFTCFCSKRIPFYADSKIDKILFLSNIPLLIIIFILNILFIVLRRYDLINNELYFWGYGLSSMNIYISIIGIFINLIYEFSFLMIIVTENKNYPLINQKQWRYIISFITTIIFIWVNIMLMSITENLLINIKINASYHSYELAIENENKIRQKQNQKDNIEENTTNDHESQEKNKHDINIDKSNEENTRRKLNSKDIINNKIRNSNNKDIINNLNIEIKNNIKNNINIKLR